MSKEALQNKVELAMREAAAAEAAYEAATKTNDDVKRRATAMAWEAAKRKLRRAQDQLMKAMRR